jgi:hypothetical protein
MEPIVIEALIVRGEGTRVRVILEPYCLEFEADEVIDLDELPVPHGVAAGSAIAARITLTPGARLLHLGSADPYRGVLRSRDIPFALVTRPPLDFELDPAMRQREHAFFTSRGLEVRLS